MRSNHTAGGDPVTTGSWEGHIVPVIWITSNSEYVLPILPEGDWQLNNPSQSLSKSDLVLGRPAEAVKPFTDSVLVTMQLHSKKQRNSLNATALNIIVQPVTTDLGSARSLLLLPIPYPDP